MLTFIWTIDIFGLLFYQLLGLHLLLHKLAQNSLKVVQAF
jgi:hypothetical protein